MQYFVILLFLCLDLFLLKCAFLQRKGTLINVFFIFYYILQAFIAIILLANDLDYSITLVGFSVKLNEALLPYMIGSLYAILGIFIGMVVLNTVYQVSDSYSLIQRCHLLSLNVNVNVLVFFLGCVFSFCIIAIFSPFYLVNLFFLTFSFSPVVVGLLWYRLNSFIKAYWVVLLLLGLLLHSVQGSRGYALMPLALFIIGYYFAVKTYYPSLLNRRKILILGLIFLVFPFLSKIQDFRENYGRGLDVSYDTISDFFSFIGDSEGESESSGIKGSLGRLLNNPNFTIPYMCPSSAPFRGNDAMLDEIKSIVTLNGAEGANSYLSKRASLNYGVGALLRYGYYITDKTSTGLSLFADAYSRFGYIGIFFYSFLSAFILGFLEKISLNLLKRNMIVSVLLYFFILKAGILSYGITYYSFLKEILFRGGLLLIFILLFSKMYNWKSLKTR